MPHPIEAATAPARERGAETTRLYLAMGDRDVVVHVEADSDQAMARRAPGGGARDDAPSKTPSAFAEDECDEIVQSLPR